MINNISQYTNFEWKNDILWYKGRIYLTLASKFKIKILESHNSPAVGHVRFYKTYYNVRQSFYWKGMNKEIQNVIFVKETRAKMFQLQGCYIHFTFQIRSVKIFRWTLLKDYLHLTGRIKYL